MTKTQTAFIIDTICKSSHREIGNDYASYPYLYQQEISCGIAKPVYVKFFYPNGKLRREGLEADLDPYDKRIGTWKYYDSTGRLFKEYDFSTHTKKLYGITEEKYQWMFDSVRRSSEVFLQNAFGKDFYQAHIRIQNSISWEAKDEYETYGWAYPDMPAEKPYEFESIAYLIFNDTIKSESILLSFDSTLRITEVSGVDSLSRFHPVIKIDFNKACFIAKNSGIKDSHPQLQWNGHNNYEWTACDLQFDHTDRHGGDHAYKCLYIDCMSGDTSTLTQVSSENIDGYFSYFNKEVRDTMNVPAGFKKVYAGFTMNVPEDWITTSTYKGYNYSWTFSNAKDSILVDDYMNLRDKRVELAYASMPAKIRVIRVHGKDSVIVIPDTTFIPRHDEASMNRFNRHFPDNKIMGRSYDITIMERRPGLFDIDLNIYDEGVGMNSGPENWEIHCSNLDSRQRDLLLSIMESIRFSTI